MISHQRADRAFRGVLAFLFLVASAVGVLGQGASDSGVGLDTKPGRRIQPDEVVAEPLPRVLSPTIVHYFDPLQGTSSGDLVHRALAANGELAAARLDIERARARVRQAGLRPNPAVDFEQTTGRLTGARGEWETSIGLSVPLEI